MKTYIVLLAVDVFERRQHAELLEAEKFENVKKIYELLQKDIDDEITEEDVLIYELTDFIDACNNQELELELWWVTYVNIKKMSKYIIINAEAIQKRIEELENKQKDLEKLSHNPITTFNALQRDINNLKQILSQSTPLIPEIEDAIQFGKDIRSEKSFINNNFGSPFLDYEDSTEETNNYISNLKLDI